MTQAYNLSQLANNLDSSGRLDATDGLVNAVPVANGGTGAANTLSARSNLGLAIGTDIPSTTGTGASGNWNITSALADDLSGGGAGQIPYQSSSGVTSFLAAGSVGQVLQSNGASAPSWTTQNNFTTMTVFTSNGSWTIPAGITRCKVTVIGGGGNGQNGQAGAGCGGGGGGGGGTAIKIITGLTPGASVTVTVGGAGASSSFGAYCSATGGSTGGQWAGGLGGTATGGNININGDQGGKGDIPSGNGAIGGTGGASYFGGGGAGGSISGGSGSAGVNYGSGGGGGGNASGSGGPGAGGVVVIEY